ncbi:BRO-N domain-containing protein [Megamonas hypermegale]|uniref:BRO-N domain-containing protein n=1 Tax=Megamonas hypermegale TaxID=158847 RepID=UPI00320B6E65
MTSLTLVNKSHFGKIICDVYYDKQGNILMTREQIGKALGYKNPNDAIRFIHDRNKERLDKFSVSFKLNGTDGKKYNTILYTRRGVYEICRFSKQPKANAFYDWVYDLLEGLASGQIKIELEKTTKQWQELRDLSKVKAKFLNNTIKEFIEYAEAQGSKHAKKYYTIFNKLINSITATFDRDNTDIEHLNNILFITNMAEKCIHEGIAKHKPYKEIYTTCRDRLKTMQLWSTLSIAS